MAEPSIDRQALRESLLELLAFLAASAHGAVSSSKLYGPLRLMDTLGLADAELRDLADAVVAQSMVISTDAARCREFADSATMLLAHKIRGPDPRATGS